MNKNGKNEELQSRREFFKKAAKRALPILGAIVLANAPVIANAAEEAPMGCNYFCSGGCSGSCGRSCSYGCYGGCKGGCSGACSYTCQNTCKGTCQGRCSGGCSSMNSY
ncbi:MAG: Cys-Xaa-Xaa-Xaa repeat radical SAM target protein [Bacteroidales bacterium]|nr:Cys-Xaa-Xaa-Xaa repeat radical SAM target protein [Bacteroidales bacterium]